MEVSERGLSWLVPYFDLQTLEDWVRSHGYEEGLLDEDTLHDYVTSKEVLSTLPEDVQRELTAGLNLDMASNLQQRTSPRLLDQNGNTLSARASLILNPPQLQIPTREVIQGPSLQTPVDLLAQEKSRANERIQSDWPLLQTRWNRLPLAARRRYVRLDQLRARKIAALILRLPVKQKSTSALMNIVKLKPNAPEWMKKVVWSLDGRIPNLEGDETLKSSFFELALHGTTTNKEEAKTIVNALLKDMNLEYLMSHVPEQKFMDVAFHWHVSYPYGPSEEGPFIQRLKAYKKLMLVRILAGGEQNDTVLKNLSLPENGGLNFFQNVYDTPVKHRSSLFNRGTDKGLVYLVEKNHAEIREQTLHPCLVMEEFTSLMAISNEEEFNRKIAVKVNSVVKDHPEIIARIVRHNPKILIDFKNLITPSLLVNTLTHAIRQLDPEKIDSSSQNKEFYGLHEALRSLAPSLEAAQGFVEIAKSGFIKLSGSETHDFRTNPEALALFKREFFQNPQFFSDFFISNINIDELILYIQQNKIENDDSYIKRLVRMILINAIGRSEDLQPKRDTATETAYTWLHSIAPQDPELKFLIALYDFIYDPNLLKNVTAASKKRKYKGLELKKILSTIYNLLNEYPGRIWFLSSPEFRYLAHNVEIISPPIFAEITLRIERNGVTTPSMLNEILTIWTAGV